MARLNSRGTLTRNRWDFFERTNGWASVWGSVTTGGIGCYYANNSTGTMQVDIYNVTWFASVPAPWNLLLFSPPLVFTPVTPTEIEIRPIQPDGAQPAGVCGMYSARGSTFFTIQRISNNQPSGIVAPVSGVPFVTLPPGWAIGVDSFSTSNPIELSMNVWFQEVLDNVAPAQ